MIGITTQEVSGINPIRYTFIDKIILGLYSIFLILSPFYLWESGLPQIADIVMIFLFIILILTQRFRVEILYESKMFLLLGLVFVTYVIFINLLWMLILNGSVRFILTTASYIYNLLITATIVVLYSRYADEFLQITFKSIVISVVLQFILFISKGSFSGVRATAGFNNPNQLGYYTLLVISIMIIISRISKISPMRFFIGFVASGILVLSSLSNAAMLSFAGIFIIFLFRKTKNVKFNRIMIVLTLLIIFSSIYTYKTTNIIQENQLLKSVQVRLSTTKSKVITSSDSRGYYRILDYPQYWIFGAGEGGYSRFESSQIEFHSTLGNIQVSYGGIGLLLFLIFLYKGLKNDKFISVDILIFILVGYGSSHNGIRSNLLWIVMGIMATKHRKIYN